MVAETRNNWPLTFDARSVKDAWDRAADSYAEGQASGLDFYRYEFFGPAQAQVCGDVRGVRLLDVGCGTGCFAREMAPRRARVTGHDLSPRMIARATEIRSASPIGIEYRVCDAVDLAAVFAARSFDMATSCLALQDMPDPRRALRAVASVLAVGGRFVAS